MSGKLSAGVMLVCTVTTAAHAKTPVEGPEAFLRRIYAPYLRGQQSFPSAYQDPSALFAARLAALIRQDNDEAAAKGEVTALDQDPFCDCQDFDALTHLSIQAGPVANGRTKAVVRFMNGTVPVTVTYTLIATGSGWRIEDLGERSIPSLVAFMARGVPLSHR